MVKRINPAAGVSGKERENKVKQAFYSEYMQKKRPKVPRFLCSSYTNYVMGILSPSLCAKACMDEKENAIYADYVKQVNKYLCYRRKLRKDEWKAMYRRYRVEKRQQACKKGV